MADWTGNSVSVFKTLSASIIATWIELNTIITPRILLPLIGS